MPKQMLFSNEEQVERCRQKIIIKTNETMEKLLLDGEGIEFLRQIKFKQCGYDPLFEEPINFIEQVNQTFTYLVCLSAVELLLSIHPSHNFYVNFGTQPGYDVESEDGSIICECFASTTPDSNRKLEKDTKGVYEDEMALKKYVIYYAENKKPIHEENIRKKYKGVEIISLSSI